MDGYRNILNDKVQRRQMQENPQYTSGKHEFVNWILGIFGL